MRKHKPFTSWQFKGFLDSRQIDAETSEPQFQPQNKTHRNTALTHPDFKSSPPSQWAKNTEVGLSPRRQIEARELKTKTRILCHFSPNGERISALHQFLCGEHQMARPKAKFPVIAAPDGKWPHGRSVNPKQDTSRREDNKVKQGSAEFCCHLESPLEAETTCIRAYHALLWQLALYQPCQVNPQGFSGHLSVWFPKPWKDIFTGYYFC